MNLKKKLICLTLAGCVAQTSVVSQAMLTKDLVVGSVNDHLTEENQRQYRDEVSTTVKKTDTVSLARNEKKLAEMELSTQDSFEKKKSVPVQKQEKEKFTKKKVDAVLTDEAEKAANDLSQDGGKSVKKKISVSTEKKVLDKSKDEKTPTKMNFAEQKQKEEKTIKVEDVDDKDEKAANQKQKEEELKNVKLVEAQPEGEEKNATEKMQHEEKISGNEEKRTDKEEKSPNDKIIKTDVKNLEEQKNVAVKSQDVVKKSTYTDTKYVTEALNLVDPYIYYLTEVTQNFRLYDGSKEKISVNGFDWRYPDDEGKGSTNYMKLLFPSNAGTLSTETSANRECFSSTCQPTSKLIADMACYFHNYVRNPECKDKAWKDLNIFEKKSIDSLRTVILQMEAKNILNRHGIVIPEGKQKISKFPIADEKVNEVDQSNDRGKLISLHNVLNPKNQIDKIDRNALDRLRNNIRQGTFDYLSVEHFVKFNEDKKEYEVNASSFKMVLRLLKEGSHMIETQEVDGTNPEKILPKYITERMLMTYFMITKSKQDDIDEFYARVKENLGENIVDPGSEQDVLTRLSKRTKMLQDLKFNDNSPYNAPVLENSNAYSISEVGEDRKVKFQEKTFQDCSDIAIRHMINLLIYSKSQKWSKLLDGVNEKELQSELEKILTAIQQHKSVDFKTLKERLQLFLLRQKQIGADDAETDTRSLWNYVVSNMNQEQMEGLYPVEYVNSKNYELKAGFENSLKVLYNIACALNLSTDEKRAQAKNAIGDLKYTEDDEGKEKLRIAIEKVYKLFNENIKVSEINEFKLSSVEKKWIGKAEIQSDTNPFIVEHTDGHTSVVFDPVERYNHLWLKAHKEDIFQDEMTTLLVKSYVKKDRKLMRIGGTEGFYVVIDCGDDQKEFKYWNEKFALEVFNKMPLFYDCYTESNLPYLEFSAQNESPFCERGDKHYINNARALKFLRKVQGEQNNIDRIGSEFHSAGAKISYITVQMKNQKYGMDKFIINSYLKRNPEEPWFERYSFERGKKMQPENVIKYDDVEYFCIVFNDTVTLCPQPAVQKSKVIIPSKVNLNGKEYRVNNIDSVFNKENLIEEVSFEEGFEKLSLCRTFWNCKQLKVVRFPKSLKSLDICSSFKECPNLTTVIFPAFVENLYLSYGLFKGCSKLKPIDLSKLTSMKRLAIERWYYFMGGANDFSVYIVNGKITMPKSLKALYMNPFALSDLKNLQALELNDGLEELNMGEFALSNTSIVSFKVPKSVTKVNMEGKIFDGCEKSLKELELPDEKEGIEISDDVRELSEKLKKI